MTMTTATPEPGPSPVLLLLHGAGGNHAMWNAVRRHLDPRRRVVALDLPGHGSRSDGHFTIDAAVETVQAEVSRLAPARVVLIGDSLGGYTSMATAAVLPAERVAGLAIGGCTMNFDKKAWGALRRKGWVVRASLALMGAKRVVAKGAAKMVRQGIRQDDVDALMAAGLHMQGWVEAVNDIGHHDYLQYVRAIAAPILFINGDKDPGPVAHEAEFVAAAHHGSTARFACEHGGLSVGAGRVRGRGRSLRRRPRAEGGGMSAQAGFFAAAPLTRAAAVDASATRQRAPLSAWYALWVLVLVNVLGTVDKLIFTLVAEPLRHVLAISDTQIGLLQGVAFTLATALAMIPFGWLSDRFDRRWVLATSVVLWSACGALRGTSMTFSMLFAASVGLGVAEGSLLPINNSLIPDLFPRSQRVTANTIFGLVSLLAASLGAALGGAAVTLSDAARPHLPAAMQHLDTWRLAFFATAAAGVPIVLLTLAMPRARRGAWDAPTAAASNGSDREFKDYLRAHWRTLSGLVFGTGLTMVGFSVVGSWVPIMVARRFGVSPQQLGNGIGVCFFIATLAGTALAVIGMKIARRRIGSAGTLRVLAIGNFAFAVSAPLLLIVHSSFDVFCVLGLMVTPLITSVLVAPNAVQDMAPAPLRARVVGVMSMIGLLMQVFGPLAIGSLSDTISAISPNALVISIVILTLVTGILGATLLRATEGAFARLVRTLDAGATA